MHGMEHRTGIYPGTFDPVHSGHIAFAKKALQLCRLDEVVFLPEQRPRGKDKVTDITHRVALIEQATADISGLRVMQLASEQFTVHQTLPELRRACRGSQLTLLAGSDIARTFLHSWKNLEVLLGEVSLAIGVRSKDDPDEIRMIMTQLSHEYSIPVAHTLLSAPEADMTSSQIRSGRADLSRLHPDILGYIQKHRLYAQA